jgi:hypothetical protein
MDKPLAVVPRRADERLYHYLSIQLPIEKDRYISKSAAGKLLNEIISLVHIDTPVRNINDLLTAIR